MLDQLILRTMVYDAVKLSGATEYLLFNDSDDESAEKINAVSEGKLIEWIFNNPYGSKDYLIYEELGIGRNYKPYFEVKRPIIKDSEAPGDIDILLVDPDRPDKAIAFQVKRVKAAIDEENKANLKINGIGRGIDQTRHMVAKYRFHKSYLMVLLVSDGSQRTEKEQMFRYLTLDEKRCIYEHSGFEELPEEAGIFIFEIHQPSINSIDHTGILSSKEWLKAKPIDQLTDTTESIVELLRAVDQ